MNDIVPNDMMQSGPQGWRQYFGNCPRFKTFYCFSITKLTTQGPMAAVLRVQKFLWTALHAIKSEIDFLNLTIPQFL